MIAVCSVVFLGILLWAIFSVDPAYYYPRLRTDQLLYYLKGLWFVQHGTTDARAAINVEPFVYAAGPGLIRVPFLAAFTEFDHQLRAIQVSNLAMAWVLAVMSAYVFSEVLPRRYHKAAIAFAFISQLLNPIWVTNVFSPLADLPFAAASLGTIILFRQIVTGSVAERSSTWRKLACAILFVVAFLCRFTALAMLGYAWMLVRERRREQAVPKRSRRTGLIVTGLVLLVVLANLRTIVFGYAWQPVMFLVRADISTMVLNTLTVAVPSQIVPGFEQLYRLPPVLRPFDPQFGTNSFDVALLIGGLAVTVVISVGMWSSRRTRRADLTYVLLPLPILAMLIPSTTRYLLTYQPFYWLFMTAGAAAIRGRYAPGFILTRRVLAVAGVVVVLGGISTLGVRSARLTKNGASLSSFSPGETRRHATEVARTYRTLRDFLERLPIGRTLVINGREATGQWKVIAGVDHYQVSGAVTEAAARKDIYLIVDCPTPATCREFDHTVAAEKLRLLKLGKFDFEKVFETGNPWSAARVYRLNRAG